MTVGQRFKEKGPEKKEEKKEQRRKIANHPQFEWLCSGSIPNPKE